MSDWISVNDRLPNDRLEILFYIKELQQVELGKWSESKMKWIIPYRETYYNNGANWVTHWMPLPKPPVK